MRQLAPLGIAFVVLLALVVWRESTSGVTRSLDEEAGLKALQVSPFTADDVTKVEVMSPGSGTPAYTLVREDRSWRVLGTFRAPASGANVNKLLEALAKAEGEFRASDSAALEQFDLVKERAVGVRVTGKDDATLMHIALGRTSGSQGAFVRNVAAGADDAKAYAVTSNLRGLLGLSRTSVGERTADAPEADFFHDKEFPPFKFDTAKEIELVVPGRRVTLVKAKKDEKDKGEWKVGEGGPGASLKKDGVEGALRAFGGGFRPTNLVDPSKKQELGLDAPTHRLSVTTDDGTKRVVVGAADAAGEHWYVRLDAALDPDVVYETGDYEFHQLFQRGTALFDVKLPEIKDADLGRIEIVSSRADGLRIVLERAGTKPTDDWKLAEAPKLTTKQSALRGIAGALKGLRPIDYVDAADLGPAEITLRYGPLGAKPEDMQTLEIGATPAAGKDRLFRFAGSSVVWVMPEATVERLTPPALSLFEAKLLHGWTEEDVKSVVVNGAKAFTVTRDGDGWTIVQGEEKKSADADAVDAWIGKLLDLEMKGTRGPTIRSSDDLEATVFVERVTGGKLEIGLLPTTDGKRWALLGMAGEYELSEKDLIPDPGTFDRKAAPPQEQAPAESPPK